MSHTFGTRFCRLVAPSSLPERCIVSGSLGESSLADNVVLTYVFEVPKPWFPSSQLLPELTRTVEIEYAKLTPTATIGDQFERLLRAVNTTLNAVSESGETDWIGTLNGIIFVMARNELHFSQTGRCPAYLLQRNKIRQITDDPSDEHEAHPLKTFSNLSSGSLHEGDTILLATSELYREVSLDALRRVLNGSTPFAACHAIAKELKRNQNARVAATILQITSPESAEKADEPREVFLEEVLENNAKRLHRRLKPVIAAATLASKSAAKNSAVFAGKAHATVKGKVAPHAAVLAEKGKQHAQTFQKTIKEKVLVDDEPDDDAPVRTPTPSNSSIERIYPNVPKHTKKEGAASTILLTIRTSALHVLRNAVTWLREPLHAKLAAGLVATLTLAFVISTVHTRRKPADPTPTNNANTSQLITQARDLVQQVTAAIDLQQLVEASRKVETAQKTLASVQATTVEQKTEVSQLWDKLTVQADTLTSTTRFTDPAAQYTLSGDASSLVVQRPFFLGGGSQLFRVRSGDGIGATGDVSLTSADTITAMTKSKRTDTSAFALTKSGTVYRVVQNGERTTLVAASAEGGFASASSLGSYGNNLYMLDSATGLLWRYTSSGLSSFGKGVSLLDINTYDLKRSVSVAIDGSIYILAGDGSLQKFTSGKRDESFNLKDQPMLSQVLARPMQVVTDDTMQSIFILDGGITSAERSMAKVLEFKKDGSFVRQYAFPANFTNIKAFEVSTSDRKLWVLNGKQISEFNL